MLLVLGYLASQEHEVGDRMVTAPLDVMITLTPQSTDIVVLGHKFAEDNLWLISAQTETGTSQIVCVVSSQLGASVSLAYAATILPHTRSAGIA